MTKGISESFAAAALINSLDESTRGFTIEVDAEHENTFYFYHPANKGKENCHYKVVVTTYDPNPVCNCGAVPTSWAPCPVHPERFAQTLP
jgi:hypothetical protein